MNNFLSKIFGGRHESERRAADGSRSYDRRKMHPLEGAGRLGWDTEQNTGYGSLYGNPSGPSTYVQGGEIKHFRGRGPKNYRRPDNLIREDINDRLTDDRYVDASEIEVDVKEGEVILSGYVPDRAAKRRAEDLAEGVFGVKYTENRLKVKN
jgi:hypothetical protein